jgi:hypothetical protein
MIRAVGARGGYVFTDGAFTREARVLARCSRVELIDGQSIIDWLRGEISPEVAALEPQVDGEVARIA